MSLPGTITIIGLLMIAGFLVLSWVIIRKEEKHGDDD